VWLFGPGAGVTVAAKSSISAARTRLGWEPMKLLHDELVKPIAQAGTRGAWYRQWRLVSLDSTTLAVPDTVANGRAFGRPGASRGASAFPQVRFVSLVETGTHVLFGTALGAYREGEVTLAEQVIPNLSGGMLCLEIHAFFKHAICVTYFLGKGYASLHQCFVHLGNDCVLFQNLFLTKYMRNRYHCFVY